MAIIGVALGVLLVNLLILATCPLRWGMRCLRCLLGVASDIARLLPRPPCRWNPARITACGPEGARAADDDLYANAAKGKSTNRKPNDAVVRDANGHVARLILDPTHKSQVSPTWGLRNEHRGMHGATSRGSRRKFENDGRY